MSAAEPTARELALNAEVTTAIILATHHPTPEAWDRVAAAEQAIAECEDHDENERAIARDGVVSARQRAETLRQGRRGEKLASAYARYVAAVEGIAVEEEAIAANDSFSPDERQQAAARAAECRSQVERLLRGVGDVAGLVVKMEEWRRG